MLLTCRAVAGHLDAHGHELDDDQPDGARLARACVSLHLAICHHCHGYWKQLRALRAALAIVGADAEAERPVSPRTKEALAARFRAWHAALPDRGRGR
jgi:hypothetical protein